VIDFETLLFVGSLLLRIKDVVPFSINDKQQGSSRSNNNNKDATSNSTTSSTSSYFDGKRRKFQAVVTGKFKKQSSQQTRQTQLLKMSNCITGQTFTRRAGRLPAPYIVHGLVKFITLLAPQLQVTLHGDAPRFTSPLVSTAQTCLVQHGCNTSSDCNTANRNHDNDAAGAAVVVSMDLEAEIEEPPPNDPTSLLYDIVKQHGALSSSSSWTVATRIKHRKKVFNQLYAESKQQSSSAAQDGDDDHHHHRRRRHPQHHRQPVFEVDKVYTFEFYQHLLHFNDEDDLKVDVGIGNMRIGLSQPLNGQPLKFMAAAAAVHDQANNTEHEGDEQPLWSFDIWHASLYKRAADVAAAATQDAAAACSARR
jgi:Protein of unknown function (DUF1769)